MTMEHSNKLSQSKNSKTGYGSQGENGKEKKHLENQKRKRRTTFVHGRQEKKNHGDNDIITLEI